MRLFSTLLTIISTQFWVVFCNSDAKAFAKELIVSIQLNESFVGDCEKKCFMYKNCSAWSLIPLLDSRSNNSNNTLSSYYCYLQSHIMNIMINSLPSAFKLFRSVSGEKLSITKFSTVKDMVNKLDSIEEVATQVQQLLVGPVVTDKASTLNFPQHFVKGCSYTLSIWVWLWQEENPTVDAQTGKVIFASKEIFPQVQSIHPFAAKVLLPTVLFNVGKHPNKFFFSASVGSHNDDYLGFWVGNVRFREWIHLAMVIDNNVMYAYIDGEYMDYLTIFPDDKNNNDIYASSCVYDLGMKISISDHTENNSKICSSTKSSKECTRSSSNSNAYIKSFLTEPWSGYVNNTVLHVAGQMTGQYHSTVGMLQQLVVVRNYALNRTQINSLRLKTRPVRDHRILQQLLQDFGIHNSSSHHRQHVAVEEEKEHKGNIEERHQNEDYFQMMINWKTCSNFFCNSIMCLNQSNICTILFEDNNIFSESMIIRSTNKNKDHRNLPAATVFSSPPLLRSATIDKVLLLNPPSATKQQLQQSATTSRAKAKSNMEEVELPDIGHSILEIAVKQQRHDKRKKITKSNNQKKEVKHNSLTFSTVVRGGKLKGIHDDDDGDIKVESTEAGNVVEGGYPYGWIWIKILNTIREWWSTTTTVFLGGQKKKVRKENAIQTVSTNKNNQKRRKKENTLLVMSNDTTEPESNNTALKQVSRDLNLDNNAGGGFVDSDAYFGIKSLSLESKVQQLYKTAMVWLNGRYEVTTANTIIVEDSDLNIDQSAFLVNDDGIINDNVIVVDNERYGEMRAVDKVSQQNEDVIVVVSETEKAQAALMVAMWLAGDVTKSNDRSRSSATYNDKNNNNDDDDAPIDPVEWAFKYSSMISQPLRLALGYQAGYNTVPVLTHPAVNYIHHNSDDINDHPTIQQQQQQQQQSVPAVEVEAALLYSPLSYLLGGQKLVDSLLAMMNLADKDKWNYDERRQVIAAVTDAQATLRLPLKQTNDSIINTNSSNSSNCNEITGKNNMQERFDNTNWFEVFSNLSSVYTDSMNMSTIESLLQPLILAGLNISLIAENQRNQTIPSTALVEKKHAEIEHSIATLRPSSSSSSSSECIIAASYYFPVAQYVVSHYGANDGVDSSSVGILEEIRLTVSGGNTGDNTNMAGFGISWLLNNGGRNNNYYGDNTDYAAAEDRRRKRSIPGFGGEEDPLHWHTEADALAGDASAQTWLGKKYYWGFGGLQRDARMARIWFERAADQGDPEGLYNVGTMYANGQGGLVRNETLAHQYFLRSANAKEPFPMALHAVGRYYMTNKDLSIRNWTLAREYLYRAADRHSEDAHFSLAMMYREGDSSSSSISDGSSSNTTTTASNRETIKVNIPRCVAHLAQAASMGHVRSISFLSHALYDSGSWLAQYGREQHMQRRQKAMLAVLTSTNSTRSKKQNHSSFVYNNIDNKSTDAPHSSLYYNENAAIYVFINDGSIVPLPHPIGSSQGACEAALPLLKQLAEMGYRTRDVTQKALKEYMKGDYWKALDLYEEAADLGVRAAQENAAYIYEQLISEECLKYADFSINNYYEEAEEKEGSNSRLTQEGSIITGVTNNSNTIALANGNSFLRRSNSNSCVSGEDCCKQFLSQLATRRWRQLANAGEARAMRKVADAILSSSISNNNDNNNNFDMVIQSGSSDDDAITSQLYYLSKEKQPPVLLQHHQQQQQYQLRRRLQHEAALLYALAAEQGDAESLMQLGWMLYYGDGTDEAKGGIVRNQTLAISIFTAALQLEMGFVFEKERQEADVDKNKNDDYSAFTSSTSPSLIAKLLREHQQQQQHQLYLRRWQISGHPSPTTGGVAPLVALSIVQLDQILLSLGYSFDCRDVYISMSTYIMQLQQRLSLS